LQSNLAFSPSYFFENKLFNYFGCGKWISAVICIDLKLMKFFKYSFSLFVRGWQCDMHIKKSAELLYLCKSNWNGGRSLAQRFYMLVVLGRGFDSLLPLKNIYKLCCMLFTFIFNTRNSHERSLYNILADQLPH